MAEIYIGTSGWSYKHWQGNFYPAREKNLLKYYAENFSTVEVNTSFYHLIKEETAKHWLEAVPEDFIFAVKGSRYITHMKKLKDFEQYVPNFIKSIEPFQDRIGVVLFQLPPGFKFNPERLEAFLNFLPKTYRYTLEFRDPDWFREETYSLLEKYNAAFCIYHLGDFQSPKVVTTDFVYIRLHGTAGLGAGKYPSEKLEEFAADIKRYGKKVFCYFNNDDSGFAPQNAAELKLLTC